MVTKTVTRHSGGTPLPLLLLMLAAVIALGALLNLSCALADEDYERDARPTLIKRAQTFRSLLEEGEHRAARAMMVADARRWWESREGPGSPWTIGPDSPGPWAEWDDHFRSESETVEWRSGPSTATAVNRETNDYYRLLERTPGINETTYFFDESGLIEGLLIRAVGDRDQGRTEKFLAWAREHDPDELAALMPGGEIDPSGDHPQRFRRLLTRWRRETGRETID